MINVTTQETPEHRLSRMRERGRLGGIKNRDRQLARDPFYFEKLGELGGESTRVKYQDDPDHWSTIGQMGADKLMETRGPEYHRQIGKLGAASKLWNAERRGGI